MDAAAPLRQAHRRPCRRGRRVRRAVLAGLLAVAIAALGTVPVGTAPVGTVPAAAQGATPFACEPHEAFTVDGATGTISRHDLSVAPFTTSTVATGVTFTPGGLGFNLEDGLLYGIDDTTKEVLSFGADGTVTAIGVTLPTAQFPFAGAMDRSGNLYLQLGPDELFVVDVSTATFTGPVQMSEEVFMDDWAVHPADGRLYGYDENDPNLAIVDPATGVVSLRPLSGPNRAGLTTGAWFDAAGDLFVAGGTADQIVRIDGAASGSVTRAYSTGAVPDAADWAACDAAPVVLADASPSPVPAGAPATFTYTIAHGAAAALVGDLTDTLPPGVFVQSVAVAGATSFTQASIPGTRLVAVNALTVPPAGTATVTVTALVGSGVPPGTVTVQASFGALAADWPGLPGPSDPTELQIGQSADLRVAVTASTSGTVQGADLDHTVTVTNDGPSNATDVLADVSVPGGVTVSGTTGCAEDPAGTPTCSLGMLTPGTSATFTVEGSVDDDFGATSVPVAVTASSDATDPDPSDDTGLADTPIVAEADIEVTVTESADPVLPGEQLTYTATFTNLGPDRSGGFEMAAVVVVTPPLVLGVPAATGSVAWTCTSVSFLLACEDGPVALPPGGSETLVLTYDVPADAEPQTARFEISVDDGPPNDDPDRTNDQDVAEETSIALLADLAITATAAPDPVSGASDVVVTAEATNSGPSAAPDVRVAAAVPAGSAFSPASSDDRCGEAGGTVTCPIGSLGGGESESVAVAFAVGTAAIDGTVLATALTISDAAVDDANSANDAVTVTATVSNPDGDGDGVPDGVEAEQGTDPDDPTSVLDSDSDGVPDHVETSVDGTDPDDSTSVLDSDSDGVPDFVERVDGTDPDDPTSFLDSDGGGVPDFVERRLGADPDDPSDDTDTDNDGVADVIELDAGTSPTNPEDFPDADSDGVPDRVEMRQSTDPDDPTSFLDSDGDGVADAIEARDGSGPGDPGSFSDRDGDGIPDRMVGRDLDGDGVDDADEYDTDGDGTGPDDTDGDGTPDFLDTTPLVDVSATFGPPPSLAPGGTGEVSLVVTNGGPSAATGVSVTIDLPEGVTLLPTAAAEAGTAVATCSGRSPTVECVVGGLAAGASDTTALTVSVDTDAAPGERAAILAAASDGFERFPGDDTQIAVVLTVVPPDTTTAPEGPPPPTAALGAPTTGVGAMPGTPPTGHESSMVGLMGLLLGVLGLTALVGRRVLSIVTG